MIANQRTKRKTKSGFVMYKTVRGPGPFPETTSDMLRLMKESGEFDNRERNQIIVKKSVIDHK